MDTTTSSSFFIKWRAGIIQLVQQLGYVLDEQIIVGWIPSGVSFFSSVQIDSGTHRPPIQWLLEALSAAVK
jgi:hypothetical protein